jgi:hypothetical protein
MGNQSRTYRHLKCGGLTTVKGETSVMLAKPFLPPSLTDCAACGSTDVIEKFVWTHTEETISEAHKRIQKGLPTLIRFAAHPVFIVLALLIPIIAGILVGIMYKWWAGLLVGVGGMIILSGVFLGIANFLSSVVFKIKFDEIV